VRISICKGIDHTLKAIQRLKGKVKIDW
jgi:hypothetical protein